MMNSDCGNQENASYITEGNKFISFNDDTHHIAHNRITVMSRSNMN